MRRLHRPRNRIKRKPSRLSRKLHFTPDIKEREITRYQMMGDTGGFIEDIDLSADDVLGFFAVVVEGFGGAGFDFVEAGG